MKRLVFWGGIGEGQGGVGRWEMEEVRKKIQRSKIRKASGEQ